MRSKMKNKKKNILVAWTMALMLFVSAALGMVFSIYIGNVRAQGNGEVTLIGGEIEEDYILNDFIDIPAAQISYAGETKDADISVIQPDG